MAFFLSEIKDRKKFLHQETIEELSWLHAGGAEQNRDWNWIERRAEVKRKYTQNRLRNFPIFLQNHSNIYV